MLKKIKIFREYSLELKNQNIGSYAAGTAFFIFLSIIPMIMLFFAILPYTPVSQEQALEFLSAIFPTALQGIMQSMIMEFYNNSFTLLSVSAVVILWAAAKGMLGMTYGLNAIYDVVETRNYFLMRLKACFETLLLIILVVISLVLMVFGNVLVKLILSDFPRTMDIYQFLMKFRFLVSWCVLTLVFAFIYKFFPNKKMILKRQIPGAIFTAIVWSLYSWAFSIYVEYVNFGMYGSFATIAILMIWLYSCMYIFFLGAYLNRSFRSMVLKFLATTEEKVQQDKEKDEFHKIIKNRDFRGGKKLFKDLDKDLVKELRDPTFDLSEAEQKEIVANIRRIREERKKEKIKVQSEAENKEQYKEPLASQVTTTENHENIQTGASQVKKYNQEEEL